MPVNKLTMIGFLVAVVIMIIYVAYMFAKKAGLV